MKEIIKGEPVLFFQKEGEVWNAYGIHVEAFMEEVTARFPGVLGDYREVRVGEGRIASITLTDKEMDILMEGQAHARITQNLVAVVLR